MRSPRLSWRARRREPSSKQDPCTRPGRGRLRRASAGWDGLYALELGVAAVLLDEREAAVALGEDAIHVQGLGLRHVVPPHHVFALHRPEAGIALARDA